MRFAGLDIHKRVVEAVVLDEAGTVLHRERFACERKALETFARRRLGDDCKVALEATTNTWAVVDVLRPLCAEVVVSNPLRTRAIAEAKVKTDKVDALVLGQLLRVDFLPSVWHPDGPTRLMRQLTTRRASLVGDRTRVKNRIHAVLHQRLVVVPFDRLFSKRGLAWVRSEPLDPQARTAIDAELRLLDGVEREIASADVEMAKRGYDDPRVRLLMTLPGVDIAVAQTVLAALGEVRRFKNGDKAASYLGLVPSTRQSADHCYHGPITKTGRGHTRWMLVQAAQHLGTHPGPLGAFFRKMASRKNRNVAVVAVARKLVTIAWHMLTKNEPYRYAVPLVTENKLSKLRVKAGAVRRNPGPKKGAAQLATRGSGARSRLIPSLPDVYDREGVPPAQPLTAGERRAVETSGTAAFVDSTRTAKRVPRRRRAEQDTAT